MKSGLARFTLEINLDVSYEMPETTEKPTQHGFFPDGETFQSTPNRVLVAHAEWLPVLRLRRSVLPVQYIQKIVEVGSCLDVMAQWQRGMRYLRPGRELTILSQATPSLRRVWLLRVLTL